MTNTRGRGEQRLLGSTGRGNVVGNREKGVSIGKKIREKYDQCSSFLTLFYTLTLASIFSTFLT